MPSQQYGTGVLSVVNRDINLIGSVIKAMLVTPSYTFNAAHDFVNDVSTQELNGTGYVPGFAGSGRKALTSKTLTLNTGQTRVEFDAADLTWAGLTAGAGSLGGVILYQEGTSDADSRLVAFLDPTDMTPNGSDVTVAWSANGILSWGYPTGVYPQGWLKILNRTVDLVGGTIKAALVATGYTYNTSDEFMSSITELPNGTGYVGGFAGSGRKTFASKAIANDAGNSRIEFTAADVVWPGINAGIIGGVVIYASMSADGDSHLIAFDNVTDTATNGGAITYGVNVEGLLQWTYV